MSSKEKDEKQIVKISYPEFYQKYLKDVTANVVYDYMVLIQLHRGNTFSKNSMLSDENYETSVANEPKFWRSSCQCQISNQSFESEVMLDPFSNELSSIYGQHGVDFRFYNGKVYFRVKKMAQRAAMIHAYYHELVSDIQDVQLLHEEEAESFQQKLTPKVPVKKIEKKQGKVVDAAPQDQGDDTTSEGAEQKKLLQMSFEEFYDRYIVEESTDNALGDYMKLIQVHKGNGFSKKKMLKDQSYETSAANEPTYWRSTCLCPISNRSVESEVLTRGNQVSTTYGHGGVDFRFFEGKIYFRVKKMAQHAAMIHACYGVIVKDNNPEHLLKEVIDAVNSNPQEASSDELEMSKEDAKEEDTESKPIQNDAFCTVAIPDDIRLLYNQGVRNDSIQSIEFHIVDPKSKDEYIKIASTPISKEMPTLMMCNIELKSPKLKVTSQRPHKSKSKAFKDTVSILIPQLLDCKHVRYQDNEEMELIALYQRYHDAEIFYKTYPPPCTIQNIFEANSKTHRFHLYTYEVPVLESLGSTCYGILFPYCESIHTCKPLILHSTGMETIAQMHQVSMVELSNDEMDILIGFNCLLQDGTSYGRSKKFREFGLSRGLLRRLSKFTEQSKERMRTSIRDRTHLFIPLDRNRNIDFSLIDKVLSNNLKSCWQLRSFVKKGETRYGFDKKKPGEVFIVSEESFTFVHDNNSVVPAKQSTSVKNDFSSILSARSKKPFIQLNERDVQIFPLPFKLMMAFHSLSFFYPQLERIFELRQLEFFLKIPSRVIEEATTTTPVAYERFEHLGDSVLFYYVALKLFLGNSNMTYDEEDMADIKAEVVKNTSLTRFGFRCGINRLLRDVCVNYVLSYLGNENSPGGIERKRRVNPCLAEVVESLLGAVFSQTFSQSNEIMTWLLNELELPLDSLGNDADVDFYNPSYYKWHGQLESMKAMLVLSSHAHIAQQLCHCLETLQRLFRLPELTIEKSMIFYSALYDDSLEWDMDDDLMQNKLILLSRFRENLFFIGEASLHLLITHECFQRFPACSAGDLHLLKACAMADDVIAYITIKNGIHKMLFDQDETEERLELLQLIEQAEYKGLTDWCTEMKRGWVLGLEEFQRRSKLTSKRSPRYCGIGGGCIIGQKAKLGKNFTEDLVFSFKAIMGACVIAFGFKQMRNLFIPIFDELLLLTPDEIRKHYSTPLTRTSSSGKRDRSHRNMEALRQKFGDGWSVFHVNDI